MSEITRGQHKDKPALLIGNGPSAGLLVQNPEYLQPFITIGVNRATQICSLDYYIAIDIACANEPWFQEYTPDTIRVLGKGLHAHDGQPHHLFAYRSCKSKDEAGMMLEAKLHQHQQPILIVGGSSICAALHLAYILGCNPIYFIGTEMTKNGYFESLNPPQKSDYNGALQNITHMIEYIKDKREIYDYSNGRLPLPKRDIKDDYKSYIHNNK